METASLRSICSSSFTRPLTNTWAWSDGGDWVAEGSPRTAFAGARVLHKLYVVRPVGAKDDAAADAAEVEFLRAFLPALRARPGRVFQGEE